MHGKIFSPLKRLFADQSGLAGIEFTLVTTVLLFALLNGLEVARWSMQKMEVRNAVRSATQAVWAACDAKSVPATTKCSTPMGTAITNGLASTSLGANVVKTTGYPTEAYYCVDSSGVLTKVGEVADPKPSDCSAVGDATSSPGDYVMLSASYTYAPLFSKITIGRLLPTTITATGSMRLK